MAGRGPGIHYTAGGNATFWKALSVSLKVKHTTTMWSAISCLGISPRQMKTYSRDIEDLY